MGFLSNPQNVTTPPFSAFTVFTFSIHVELLISFSSFTSLRYGIPTLWTSLPKVSSVPKARERERERETIPHPEEIGEKKRKTRIIPFAVPFLQCSVHCASGVCRRARRVLVLVLVPASSHIGLVETPNRFCSRRYSSGLDWTLRERKREKDGKPVGWSAHWPTGRVCVQSCRTYKKAGCPNWERSANEPAPAER